MTYSEAQKKATLKYGKNNYKRVPLDLRKEQYERVKAAADKAGESVNGYIKKSIDMRMSNDLNENE